MSSKDATDELFDLKTSFYLGSFQQAINEAQKIKVWAKNHLIYFCLIWLISYFALIKSSDSKLQLEKDVYMYRAYIAQKKYGVVLDDIKSNASDELKYIRLTAEYLSSESKRFEKKIFRHKFWS